MGFFGWTQTATSPQMRWMAKVNLDAALSSSADVLSRWWTMVQWPDAQPYSGGVLDSWPSRIAEGLALCRTEWRAVQAAVEEERKEKPGG